MTGALVRNTDAAAELGRLLDAARPRLAMIVPRGMSVDRVCGVIQNEFARNPRLRECDPPSVVRAVVQCAELGLDPSPKLRQAAFVPRRVNVKGKGPQTRCELQIMYLGWVVKAYESPRILSLDVVLVHEKDRFELQRGTHPDVLHEYGFTERGPVIGAYFAARLAPAEGNVWKVDSMTIAEIEAIRDQSDGWRAFKAGRIRSTPWKEHEDEMRKKTMLTRGLKICPLSEGAKAALEVDSDDFRASRAASVEPVRASRGGELKAKLGVVDVEGEEVADDGLDPNTLSHNFATLPNEEKG